MGSRSTAYRWSEDGVVRWIVLLPDGRQIFGTACSERAANTIIGGAARAFGSSTTTIIGRHPNAEVARA